MRMGSAGSVNERVIRPGSINALSEVNMFRHLALSMVAVAAIGLAVVPSASAFGGGSHGSHGGSFGGVFGGSHGSNGSHGGLFGGLFNGSHGSNGSHGGYASNNDCNCDCGDADKHADGDHDGKV